jgi:hypothetical protein
MTNREVNKWMLAVAVVTMGLGFYQSMRQQSGTPQVSITNTNTNTNTNVNVPVTGAPALNSSVVVVGVPVAHESLEESGEPASTPTITELSPIVERTTERAIETPQYGMTFDLDPADGEAVSGKPIAVRPAR